MSDVYSLGCIFQKVVDSGVIDESQVKTDICEIASKCKSQGTTQGLLLMMF